MNIKLFLSYTLCLNHRKSREMDVAVNGLSIDALEAQLKEFEPETIMVERAIESTLVFELAKIII